MFFLSCKSNVLFPVLRCTDAARSSLGHAVSTEIFEGEAVSLFSVRVWPIILESHIIFSLSASSFSLSRLAPQRPVLWPGDAKLGKVASRIESLSWSSSQSHDFHMHSSWCFPFPRLLSCLPSLLPVPRIKMARVLPPSSPSAATPPSPHFSVNPRDSQLKEYTQEDACSGWSSDFGSPSPQTPTSFSQPPSPAPPSPSPGSFPAETTEQSVIPRRPSEIEYPSQRASQAATSREQLVLKRLSVSGSSSLDDSFGLPLPDQTGFGRVTSKPTTLVMRDIELAVNNLVTEKVRDHEIDTGCPGQSSSAVLNPDLP